MSGAGDCAADALAGAARVNVEMGYLPDDEPSPGEAIDLGASVVVSGRDGFDLTWLRGVPPGAATVDFGGRDEPDPAPATPQEGPR